MLCICSFVISARRQQMFPANFVYSTPPAPVLWCPVAGGPGYPVWLYPIDDPLFQGGGVYIYARWNGRAWEVLYVGRTNNLARRQEEHADLIYEAKRLGATAILVHLLAEGEWSRYQVELAVYETYRPPLNRVRPAVPAAALAKFLSGFHGGLGFGALAPQTSRGFGLGVTAPEVGFGLSFRSLARRQEPRSLLGDILMDRKLIR